MSVEKLYAIYDTKDGGICVGVFESISEVAKKLGLKPNHVSSIISKKKMYKSRYSIERVEIREGDIPEE